MILPSKHISEEHALLGVGAVLLRHIDSPQTVTSLWEKAREYRVVGTYERFVLALDLLHITGAVTVAEGLIKRVSA